jgi:hypothetical protein
MLLANGEGSVRMNMRAKDQQYVHLPYSAALRLGERVFRDYRGHYRGVQKSQAAFLESPQLSLQPLYSNITNDQLQLCG